MGGSPRLSERRRLRAQRLLDHGPPATAPESKRCSLAIHRPMWLPAVPHRTFRDAGMRRSGPADGSLVLFAFRQHSPSGSFWPGSGTGWQIASAKNLTETRNLGKLSACVVPANWRTLCMSSKRFDGAKGTGNGFGGGIRPSSLGRGAQAERRKAVAGPRPGNRARSEVQASEQLQGRFVRRTPRGRRLRPKLPRGFFFLSPQSLVLGH